MFFSTHTVYVLPGTKKDNKEVIEAVSSDSNNLYHMRTRCSWDIDDEKWCNQVFKGCPLLLDELDLSLRLLLVHAPILILRQTVAIMCSSDNPNQGTNLGEKK